MLTIRGRMLRTVAAALGAWLILVPVPGSGAAARNTAIPDVTTLFGRAVQIVRATKRPAFAHAVVLEADGFTRRGKKVTTASGIVKWRFVFNNQASSSRFRSATIVYGPPPAKFGKVTGNPSPFLEDIQIPKAPKMKLSEAVALLKRAGHGRGFFGVTLRNPLTRMPHTHPQYIFTVAAGKFVGVDTVTKRVRPVG